MKKTIPILVPAFLLVALAIPMLSIVIAGPHSNTALFDRAQQHFKKQYFGTKTQRLILDGLEKTDSIQVSNGRATMREDYYRLSMKVERQHEVVVLNDCQIEDRPHCGWMSLSCQPNLSGPDLKDITRQGDQVLIFTYDQVRSGLCRQRRL